MKLTLSTAVTLAAVTAGVAALAQEVDAADIILDTSSYWRVHYTIKPPVVRKAGIVEKVTFHQRRNSPVKWIMHESPLPAAGWWKSDFDDSAWSRFPGVAPGGFNIWGNPSGDRKAPFMALVCMRGKFHVTDPAKAGTMTLSASYRGGIVVYVNGVELARGHLPAQGLQRLAADYAEGEDHDRNLPEITIPASALRKGTNVLAVEVHRSPYHEKDIRVIYNRWKTIKWGSCGLLSIQLRGAGKDGVAPNVVRPKGLQVWNSNPMKVDCDLDYGDPNESLHPVRIVGTRNGAFSGKVVVGSDKAIHGLKARPGDLKHTEGKGAIPAATVQIRYATPDHYQAGTNQRYLARATCFDSLTEVPPTEVPVRTKEVNPRTGNLATAGISPTFGAVQPVWITVNVSADAVPGDYEGRVTITIDGEKPVRVPVQLTVCGWMLPEPRDFVTWADIIQSPESVAMYYDVPLWSDAHFKYLEKSFKLLGQVGNKATYVHLIAHSNAGNAQSMVRWIKKADGTYDYDLTPMEKYLDLVQKHLGRPPVVCFYVWDTYLEGGLGHGMGYGGDHAIAAREAHAGKGPMVTLIEPGKAEVETVSLPMYSRPQESVPLWKPLMEEIRKRMRRRGLAKSMMLGIATDHRPAKEVIDFFREVAPGIPWVSQAHGMPTDFYGVHVAYVGGVHVGKFPKDPSVERTYGWKRTYTGRFAKEWSAPGGSVPVHMPRDFRMPFPVTHYRMLGEMNIAGSQRGFARLGGDFWPVIKDRRGRSTWLAARYPESSWRNLDLRMILLSPGKRGAIATHRFEMIREGFQECEARIFIEKAILDKKIDGDLRARCQTILNARIPEILWGVNSLAGASYLDGSWASAPAVLGYEYYVGSGWQEHSQELFDAAAEVARAIGDE